MPGSFTLEWTRRATFALTSNVKSTQVLLFQHRNLAHVLNDRVVRAVGAYGRAEVGLLVYLRSIA